MIDLSPKKAKAMKYKYQGVFPVLPVTYNVDEIRDTKIGHVDMAKYVERMKLDKPSHYMQRIIKNNSYLVASFPVAASYRFS